MDQRFLLGELLPGSRRLEDILYLSQLFVRATGVPSVPAIYFRESILLFLGIYLVYFIVTYIGFRRNVEEIER